MVRADDDAEPRKGLSRLSVVAAVAFLGIALYILSPGPIARLIEYGRDSDQRWVEGAERTFDVIYRPLELAYQKYPFVADFYDRYGEWLGIP